jgi:uncharacterized cupin superfamily protein
MEPVTVKRPTDEELMSLGVEDWPIWEKEVSVFDWFYSEGETFYVLEGRVKVDLDEGGSVEFGKGDLVTFAQGVGCRWDVREPIRKHYTFG